MNEKRLKKQLVFGCVMCWLLISALGQSGAPERVAIALTDPARPGMVKVTVLNGSITVKGYQGKDVVVETNQRGLKVEESDNTVTVQPEMIGQVELRLSVPARTSLQLKCTNGGNVQVENVSGEVEVNSVNTSISLKRITGVVVAYSLQGRVLVQMDAVAPGKPMSFTSNNGDVDVSLPPDTKANVNLQTLNGAIHTDFPLTLNANSEQRPGRRLVGKINGGGPEMQLKSLNGSVYLRKSQEIKK